MQIELICVGLGVKIPLMFSIEDLFISRDIITILFSLFPSFFLLPNQLMVMNSQESGQLGFSFCPLEKGIF